MATSENCTNDTIINRSVRITRLHHTDHIALIKSNYTVQIKLHHKIQTVLNVIPIICMFRTLLDLVSTVDKDPTSKSANLNNVMSQIISISNCSNSGSHV